MTILRTTISTWLVPAMATLALAQAPYEQIPDKDDQIRQILNSRDMIRLVELLGPKKQKTIEQVQQYLSNDLGSLHKLNQDSLNNPKLQRVLLALETTRDNLKNMDYKRPWGVGGTSAWVYNAWAYHQDNVDPLAIHIMDKYWDHPEFSALDSEPEKRLKEQIWYAERASLLVHEMVHGQGVPLDTTTTGNPLIEWGSKDKEAYAVQYMMLRLTISKPVDDLIALRQAQRVALHVASHRAKGEGDPDHPPDNTAEVDVGGLHSLLLVDVLNQLRTAGLIDVQGDLRDPDVYDAAIKAADAHIKNVLDIELEPLVQAVDVRASPDVPGWPPGENLPEEPPKTVEDQPKGDQPKPKPDSDDDQTPPEKPKPNTKTPPEKPKPNTKPPPAKSKTPEAVKRYDLPKGLAAAPAAGATTVVIEKWRNESYAKLDKMFQDDAERKANSEAFHKAVGWGQAQDMTCAQGRIKGKKSCGVTRHWWLGDRWSCSKCETCIMPSDHPKAKPFVEKSNQIRKKYDDGKDLVRKQADELRKAAKS
jgi:hypothetical protein